MSKKGILLLASIIFVSLSLPTVSTTGLFILDSHQHPSFVQSYVAHDPIHIDGNADFIAQDTSEGWPGDGSAEHPFIISGYSFAAAEHMFRVENSNLHFQFIDNQLDGISHAWCGIAILNSANGIIKDNYVQRAAAGIHVVTVENMVIEGNEVHDSSFSGIVVEDGSSDVLVKDNIVYQNEDFGIHIGNPYGSEISHDIEIIGNTIYENEPSGIILLEADACIVEYNKIYSNEVNGIEVQSGSHYIRYNNITDCYIGILLHEGNATINHNEVTHGDYGISVATENNTISYNELSFNSFDGLRFYHSYATEVSGSYNFITRNVLGNNSRWGLNFGWSTTMNIATTNYFFGNGEECQASNDGTLNVIDGNYWNDWTSPDANNDSIVDIPYEIAGDASNSDDHPMAIPDKSLPPWYTEPCNCGNETTSTVEIALPFDPLILVVGGSAVVIVLIVVVFMKKK